MEGSECLNPPVGCDQTGLELPVWEYTNNSGPDNPAGTNCSITGGYVFRGQGMPSLLGAYVYGDFCSGRIWGLRYDAKSVTEQMLLVDSLLEFGITSFGQDADLNLYILSRTEGISRLVPTP